MKTIAQKHQDEINEYKQAIEVCETAVQIEIDHITFTIRSIDFFSKSGDDLTIDNDSIVEIPLRMAIWKILNTHVAELIAETKNELLKKLGEVE